MRITLTACLLCVFAAVSLAAGANDAGTTAPVTFAGFSGKDVVGTDSFDGSEATMSPRFYRSGTPGDPCSTFSSGNFQYRAYPFRSDGTGQLTVSFDPGACGTGIFVTFHTGSFNPANICENYVWSNGSSAAFTETFSVPANTDLVMVVSGVSNAPNVVCGPYSYQIIGGNVTPVPTLGGWGLIAVLIGLSAAGWWLVRRRRVATA